MNHIEMNAKKPHLVEILWVRPKKNICVLPVTRPTQHFLCIMSRPRTFFDTWTQKKRNLCFQRKDLCEEVFLETNQPGYQGF